MGNTVLRGAWNMKFEWGCGQRKLDSKTRCRGKPGEEENPVRRRTR
jgi:hypothetical protein